MTKFTDFLNKKFLDYQNKLGRPVKMKEFTKYLGVPVPTYSGWVNYNNIPGMEYARILADKLGSEVYDILGYKHPAPTISIDQLPEDLQASLTSFVSEVSGAIAGLDPRSVEADEIVRSLMDKYGFNFISKRKADPGNEKQ